jgi:hypothetical protein
MEPNPRSSYSIYQKFIGKVFGFGQDPEKDSIEEEKQSSEDESEEFCNLDQSLTEEKAAKTLVLDLSGIAKDNPQIKENTKIECEIQIFDQCLTSGWLV